MDLNIVYIGARLCRFPMYNQEKGKVFAREIIRRPFASGTPDPRVRV
jgi:hypothetical protein